MNLVMLDIDGTLTQSYEYDQEVFGLAIGEALNCPPVNADLNDYADKTSLGVTREAIYRLTGRRAQSEEIEQVKRKVLWHLERMHQEFPGVFAEVPGAGTFLKQFRNVEGVVIAIATGCWLSEGLYKVHASGIMIDGIPMATSDDHWDRKEIMMIAAKKAEEYYGCPRFERIVYVGDGLWDLQTSRSLGFGFIGIGPRLEMIKDTEGIDWHQNFLDIPAVFASIAVTLGK